MSGNHPTWAERPDEGAGWSLAHLLDFLAGRDQGGGADAAATILDGVLQSLLGLGSVRRGHGSLDPWHIWIDRNGGVRVVAPEPRSPDPSRWSDEQWRYASPEQASGQGGDARSDLYGMGLVLIELLTGKPLFEGFGQQLRADVRRAELSSRIYRRRRQIPRELLPVLQGLLRREAQHRFGDAAEALDALDEARAGGPLPGLPLRVILRAMDGSLAADDSTVRAGD